jgi:phosphate butyryltransferase
MISSLTQMVEKVKALNKKHKIAIAWAQDSNTIVAVSRAVREGFAEAIMIGLPNNIRRLCC